MRIILANCNPSLNLVQDELAKKYDAIKVFGKIDLEAAIANNPDYIFFIHWSWIIPEKIYNNYKCVVFHMTDLPYGRGGSPLQNLIIRGHKNTKLSALRVEDGIDTGAIYLKKELTLSGTATEIFERAGQIIKGMISEITENEIIPIQQTGQVTLFSRRKPHESLVNKDVAEIEKLYDFIRMLDAENYPKAFLETEKFKIEFDNAKIVGENEMIANVRITKK
jgi:methionyl-tRNA formyltransferase